MGLNQSSDTKTPAPRSAVSKRKSHQRVDLRPVQSVLLIWLDSNNRENSDDCRNTIAQLRRAVNDVKICTDGDQCIQFIKTINDNKVCMMISGSLGQYVVPQVHEMSQVDSIFIFCGKKKRHEGWVKDWPKIKGVFTEITPICEALKQAAQQCEHNATPISFMATDTKGDQLDPPFMYTQILKEILLTIDFGQQHIQEYVTYCHDKFIDNKEELDYIKQLEQHYRNNTPIWWYTCDCFLYKMLNRALRVMDVDIMTRMGFFISDLHRHIEQVHKEQYGGHSSAAVFTVYRGQGMSRADFDQLLQNKGGLMSFNSFLSTSTDRSVSTLFAEIGADKPDSIGILFVMMIDPAQSTTPFASIHELSAIGNEDEVLFAMHSVFRVQDIKSMDGNNRLYEVHLSLTSDNDPQLRALTDHIREESFPNSKGWQRLALVLLKIGQVEKAEEIYKTLLNQTTSESGRAAIYNQLGLSKYNQGEYQEAVAFCEKDLAIQQQSLASTNPDLAASYNNIGMVYYNMGDYPQALSSYERALAIRQRSLPPTHPDLIASHSNIGALYKSMGDYPQALSSHKKALEIGYQSLSPTHPHLAASYNNIGLVYYSMAEYPEALSSHEKALAIRQQSLPTTHPDLAASYNNIGMVYNCMGDYLKALPSYEKALVIRQQSLPPTHPDLAASYNNIGLLYEHMRKYSKACSYLKHALQIGERSLPENHPHISLYKNNLEHIKKKKNCNS